MSAIGFRRPQRGFTLVEAIIVIVIIGVIGTIVAVFIRAPIQAYADSVERAEATDIADLALRRIARDLRLALPNSVRVNGNGSAVEFLATKTGGRYLSAEDDVPALPYLDFDNEANRRFTLVGRTSQAIAPGEYVVVYNLGEEMAPSDAYRYAIGSQMNIAKVVGAGAPAGATNPELELEDNPLAKQAVPMKSPSQRFQVVTSPVSYVCGREADGSLALRRYWDYPISETQVVPPTSGKSALIATRVSSCLNIFRYGSEPTRRSALVILNLALNTRDSADQVARLVHQVHVDNTP